MVHALKVPALTIALTLALAACGGDAESAADDGSEAMDPAGEVQPDVEPEVTPPTPPAGEQAPPPPPPPVQDTTEPDPPTEEPPVVSDPSEGDWEELEQPRNIVPVGTRFRARLTETVSTRTHAEGDTVRARITGPLLGADGAELIPEGSELIGRVATAQASTDSDEESVLVLAFDAIVLDGDALPLRATVLEAQVAGDTGASGARSVGTVATGAAAGAILGQILGGDTRSTVAGAAVGAVAGAGVALSTREGHAEVPEETEFELQIDEPFVVPVVQ